MLYSDTVKLTLHTTYSDSVTEGTVVTSQATATLSQTKVAQVTIYSDTVSIVHSPSLWTSLKGEHFDNVNTFNVLTIT